MIAKLTKLGLPVTQELPDGKWAHSSEYFKHRYSSKISKPSERSDVACSVVTSKSAAMQLREKLTHPFAALTRKLTPSERIQLMAMLEAK